VDVRGLQYIIIDHSENHIVCCSSLIKCAFVQVLSMIYDAQMNIKTEFEII